MNTASLHKLLERTAPGAVQSLRIGDPADKSTWSIRFAKDIPDAVQSACVRALESFDLPDHTKRAAIQSQIIEIEGSVTQRMLREAALGINRLPLQQVEDRIAALRAKLS